LDLDELAEAMPQIAASVGAGWNGLFDKLGQVLTDGGAR
jgi:hypothetical protein